MDRYYTLHQTTLTENRFLIKTLFGLEKKIPIGVQEIPVDFERSKKNPNQVLLPARFSANHKQYNIFKDGQDALRVLKDLINHELQIKADDLKDENKRSKDRELCFLIFKDRQEKKKEPKFRGILFATIKTGKRSYWVALNDELQFDCDKERYNI